MKNFSATDTSCKLLRGNFVLDISTQSEGARKVVAASFRYPKLGLMILFLVKTLLVSAQTESIEFANAGAPFYNIDKDSMALSGYDLTEYFVHNKAVKGSAKYQFNYQGVRFNFINEENRSTFVKNPEKYLPEFGGYCAYGFAMDPDLNGNSPGKYPVDPETFKIIDDKLYLFYNAYGYNYLEAWEKNEKINLLKAQKRWEMINKD